jgi:nucleoporin GLE1
MGKIDTIRRIRTSAHHQHHHLRTPARPLTPSSPQRTARKDHALVNASLHVAHKTSLSAHVDWLASQHTRQTQEVRAQLAALRAKHNADEERLKVAWRAREKKLWERIEGVIRFEEDKVRQKREEERMVREEEERKREEEERKRKEEEERTRREKEEREREQEERKRDEERLERQLLAALEEKDKEDQEIMRKEEEEKTAADQRQLLGLSNAAEDWVHGRRLLKVIICA